MRSNHVMKGNTEEDPQNWTSGEDIAWSSFINTIITNTQQYPFLCSKLKEVKVQSTITNQFYRLGAFLIVVSQIGTEILYHN